MAAYGFDTEATLPASDLERAKDLYAERLGLVAKSEDKTGVHYVVGGTRVASPD